MDSEVLNLGFMVTVDTDKHIEQVRNEIDGQLPAGWCGVVGREGNVWTLGVRRDRLREDLGSGQA